MSETLYLIESRAQRDYVCPSCQRSIRQGSKHFRHDPFPAARFFRGQPTTHWCVDCIAATPGGQYDSITRRIRIPIVNVRQGEPLEEPEEQLPLFRLLHINVVQVGQILLPQLAEDPNLIHSLSPDQFEEFICERLFAMRLEPRRVGSLNRKDGGIDIVFWPRDKSAFPFLGAAQVKHHRSLLRCESSASVRDFAGAVAAHPFNAGLLITNTSFSPDAAWFAKEHAKLLRLRDFADIKRWLANNFASDAEWREIPKEIELCPGVLIKVH